MAIGVADLRDEADFTDAELPGVWLVNVGPGEVGEEITGNPGSPRGHQGQRRRVAEDRRRAEASQRFGLVADFVDCLVVDLAGSLNCRGTIGQSTIARRVDRSGVGFVRVEVGGTLQALAPVVEEVRIAADRHGNIERDAVDHRDRSIQMPESVAGDVDHKATGLTHLGFLKRSLPS